MAWNAYNLSSLGNASYASYSAWNHPANGSRNHPAFGSPNHAAYTSPNHAAYSAPNHPANSSPNHAAFSSPNHPAFLGSFGPGPQGGVVMFGGGTGAGGASGLGFAGGYGPIQRFEYATPAALDPIPWVLDFTTGDGWPSFPLEQKIGLTLKWQEGDWDPALRFWTLPFDEHLTEWLQDVDLAAPAIVAARELAGQSKAWLAHEKPESAFQLAFEADGDDGYLRWNKSDPQAQIWRELAELEDLMRDDRLRYIDELAVQSAHSTPYFVHLMNFDPASKPWTMELMNCATALGNLVKMQYKSVYKRVRPSTLCPGLTPPWGPPRHPAFPSGHSTVSHLTALLLLSVPGIADRFGVFEDERATKGSAPDLKRHFMGGPETNYGVDQRSPLLWLAWRIAKGRERLGIHYRTDSAAGRRLAALLWAICTQPEGVQVLTIGAASMTALRMPALKDVIQRASSEWPPL